MDRRLDIAAPGDGRRRPSAFAMRQTLDALAASENTPIIGTDADARVTSWGAGAAALYGWREDEVLGHSILMLAPPERASEIEIVRESLLAGRSVHGWETDRVH